MELKQSDWHVKFYKQVISNQIPIGTSKCRYWTSIISWMIFLVISAYLIVLGNWHIWNNLHKYRNLLPDSQTTSGWFAVPFAFAITTWIVLGAIVFDSLHKAYNKKMDSCEPVKWAKGEEPKTNEEKS